MNTLYKNILILLIIIFNASSKNSSIIGEILYINYSYPMAVAYIYHDNILKEGDIVKVFDQEGNFLTYLKVSKVLREGVNLSVSDDKDFSGNIVDFMKIKKRDKISLLNNPSDVSLCAAEEEGEIVPKDKEIDVYIEKIASLEAENIKLKDHIKSLEYKIDKLIADNNKTKEVYKKGWQDFKDNLIKIKKDLDKYVQEN